MGVYIKTSSGLQGRFDGNGRSNILSAKALGCKANGSTDDTVALQNAINTAANGGYTLYLDAGTYKVTDRLNITKQLHIIGAGNESTILDFTAATVHETTPYDDQYWDESNAAISIQADDVELSDFCIGTGSSTSDRSQYHGVIFHYPVLGEYKTAMRAKLNNLRIRNFNKGIYSYGSWGKQINQCFIYDCNYGVYFYPLEQSTVGYWSSSGDILIDCYIVACTYAGVYAENAHNLLLEEVVCEHCGNAFELVNNYDVECNRCWNEANTGNILVTGKAKFSNCHGVSEETITHTTYEDTDTVRLENNGDIIELNGTEVVFEQLNGIIVIGGGGGGNANIWYGTAAEYETAKDTIEDGTQVCITDDNDGDLFDFIVNGNS